MGDRAAGTGPYCKPVDAGRLVAPLAADPGRSAIVLDLDGTLAPIVGRPELARVPEETRAELRRLVARYLLVACVSGRAGDEAEALVGVEGIRYVGNHGLELDPGAARAARSIAAFREAVDEAWPVEDKGLSLSYHYREAPDEAAAVAALSTIAERARVAGLETRWGRKVLEVRPPLAADKGTAVRTLLRDAGARRALYAGDDTTDLDAFRGLGEAGLETAVRVAVASAESAPALLAAADVVVDGPAGMLDVLRLL
jgi:trehalose 6-phosphate phosphatase